MRWWKRIGGAGMAFGRRAALSLASATLLVACTSPTLPLPPPIEPTISLGSEPNTVILRSERGSLPNALIVIVNRNESLPRNQRVSGTLADGQGSWDVEIVASTGDVLDISQETGTTQSPVTTVTVR